MAKLYCSKYMDQAKIVVVREYGSRPEADLAKTAPEAAEIQCVIQADTAGGMREHLAWSGSGFKILVREEDAAAANDALTPPREAEIPDAGPDLPPSWRRFT